MRSLRRVSTGIGWALRAHWGIFAAVTSVVLALDVLVPVVVLSLARRPVDYFTFNPWLPNLPGFLASGKGPLDERLDKAWGLALFWFSADGVFGIDWGFAVTAADLARFALMAALIGAYFALWRYRRDQTGAAGRGLRLGRRGGAL